MRAKAKSRVGLKAEEKTCARAPLDEARSPAEKLVLNDLLQHGGRNSHALPAIRLVIIFIFPMQYMLYKTVEASQPCLIKMH